MGRDRSTRFAVLLRPLLMKETEWPAKSLALENPTPLATGEKPRLRPLEDSPPDAQDRERKGRTCPHSAASGASLITTSVSAVNSTLASLFRRTALYLLVETGLRPFSAGKITCMGDYCW